MNVIRLQLKFGLVYEKMVNQYFYEEGIKTTIGNCDFVNLKLGGGFGIVMST